MVLCELISLGLEDVSHRDCQELQSIHVLYWFNSYI